MNNELYKHPQFGQIGDSTLDCFEKTNKEFMEVSRNVTDNFIQECEKRKNIVVNHVHELEQLYEKIDIDLQHSGIEYVKLAIPDFEEREL